MSIKKAIEEYLEWKKSYAPVAAKGYVYCLNRFAKCNKSIEQLHQLDIIRFIEKESLRLKANTVVYYVNILKDFFGYFRCNVNPKLIRRPKFTAEPRNFLTEEEFNKMDAVLNKWEYYDLQKKVAIHLLWNTGIRVSELIDLNLLDIENSKTIARIITKKNQQYRWIMWAGDSHELLMKYIGTKLCIDSSPALFSTNNRRLTTKTIQCWVRTIARRAGIERRVYPHMFRHGKAHKMLSDGANLNDVKTILGHTTILSTQAYTKLFPEEFNLIAKRYV